MAWHVAALTRMSEMPALSSVNGEHAHRRPTAGDDLIRKMELWETATAHLGN